MSEQLQTDPHEFRDFLIARSQQIEDDWRIPNTMLHNREGTPGLGPRMDEARFRITHNFWDDIEGTEIVDETALRNALHFMEDIELFHALLTDDLLADPKGMAEDEMDFRDQMELTRKTASAINYTLEQIEAGNTLIIGKLDELERTHNEQYGVLPYSEATSRDWDGWQKWDEFRKFVEPSVPDVIPPED